MLAPPMIFKYPAAFVLWVFLQVGFAQTPQGAQQPAPATPPAAEDPLGRQTPYGCMKGFLMAVGRNDYARGAEYLDTRANRSQAEEIARKLGVVIDFGLPGSLAKISRSPAGELRDSLPTTQEHVGSVVTNSGSLDIVLNRVHTDDGSQIWLFSSETLRNVPKFYEKISAPGIVRRLPAFLRDTALLSIPLWRWLSAIIGITLAFALASILTRALIPVLRPLVRRITGEHDDARMQSLRGPLRLAFLAAAAVAFSSLATSLLAREIWMHVGHVTAILAFAWMAIELDDVVTGLQARKLISSDARDKLAVLVLLRRFLKVVVVLVAATLLLRSAGVNVTAVLAGLGIGGVALAFGAQQTLENLLAGVSLISREAIRVGDLCRIGDQTGTVEDIGFGFTRIRTFGRTVVSIPNAKIAQTEVENITLRDKFWFHHVFAIRYDTSPEQMRSTLTGIRKLMRDDSRVEKETERVRFIGFGPSSLDIEVFAYVRANDHTGFLAIQEELLLDVMDIVAISGAKVALPSQITYLKRDLAKAPEPAHSKAKAGFWEPS